MQTCQISDLARFTVNLDVGAMIFHENKVKYLVTWEKFPKIRTNANERGTFENLFFDFFNFLLKKANISDFRDLKFRGQLRCAGHDISREQSSILSGLEKIV